MYQKEMKYELSYKKLGNQLSGPPSTIVKLILTQVIWRKGYLIWRKPK